MGREGGMMEGISIRERERKGISRILIKRKMKRWQGSRGAWEIDDVGCLTGFEAMIRARWMGEWIRYGNGGIYDKLQGSAIYPSRTKGRGRRKGIWEEESLKAHPGEMRKWKGG